MKKVKHLIEYFFVVASLPFFALIPYRARIKIGSAIGLSVYYLYRKRRLIALENITKSFPEKDKDWHNKICKKSFAHFGINAMEYVQLKKFSSGFIEKYISLEGEGFIKEALSKGKGIVGICPHLGNWEFIAACVALKGYPVSVIMKRQSNLYINKMIEKLRGSFKLNIIYKSNAGAAVLKALKDNRIVAFVADQDAGSKGIFVDFLGRPASTAQGPARFAVSCQSPALVFTGTRQKKGKFKITTSPALEFNYNRDKKKNVRENTVLWTKEIEKYIKKYPEQYFWVHRRWKTREQ